jgi:MFS-type transporter involved in bile tolerance (Atg22 family)
MAAVTAVTGSSRLGIVSVVAFFAVGGLLLSTVDVDAGRRQALALDEAGTPAAA